MKKNYPLFLFFLFSFSFFGQNNPSTKTKVNNSTISDPGNKVEMPACNIGTYTQVASLPFTSALLTTCGQGDNVTATSAPNICGSSLYYGGEDAIYTFTPTTTGPIGVDVTSTGSWMGLTIYTGCPNGTGGTCIAYSQSSSGNQSVCFNATAGTPYIAIIDSWPSPTCNPYQITISGCTGAPNGGTAVATPSLKCATYTTNLTLSGATPTCGATFQWQSGTSSTGPWTNITGATSSSTVVTVSATTYYRCVLACGASTAASTPATASLTAAGSCGLCGILSITIPYSITGQTTCGAGDDVTSSNVTNICGSSLYYGGEDVVYSFTPTTTGQIGINVTSTGSYMGVTLYQGCPVSGGACVGAAQSYLGNQSMCVSVTAGLAYYLVLDSWPSPTCNPYDLNITTCSGAPTAGTTVATPNIRCSNFTTTLSTTGTTPTCGLSYQWQSAPASTGPWSNITGATASTATSNVTANTYFRCIVSCGASSATTAIAGTTITPVSGCGLCGINSITLPYSTTGQTTCGQVDDLTATNASTVCGSSGYYGGEDAIYSFTPSISGQISVSVTSTGSQMGLMLYQGCPISGGTCNNYAQGWSGNESFCANVIAGQAYYLVIDSWPSPACNPYNLSISAPSGTTIPCNMAYTAATCTYSFETFSGTTLPTTDDVLYSQIANFGFPFCFDGTTYWGGYIASNAALVFDAVPCYPNVYFNQNAAPGINTGWSITAPAPSKVNGTSSTPQNAILAPWHDINPGLGGVIQYTVMGTSPNRRFITSFENVPMFSCGTSSPTTYYSGQIKLFETTNNIEIHVKQKKVCPGWNNGEAILGLQNYDGTIYISPVGSTTMYNATGVGPGNQWTMSTTAYRFTTSCGSGGTCKILPIHFKDFYAERVNKVNYLYWETTEEDNLSSFKVMRSTDAEHFTEIGSVVPNNKYGSKYSFKDETARPGLINYYQITAVEKDGERTSTFIYPLGSNYGEVSVSEVYPNPVKDYFNIGIDSKLNTDAIITIYDAVGNIVKVFTNSVGTGISQLSFNISDLNAGIYILEVTNSNKDIIQRQKLTKVD